MLAIFSTGDQQLGYTGRPMTDPRLPTVLHVAVSVPLLRTFDYLPPIGCTPDPSWLGCRVQVPFANGEKMGVVLAIGVPQDSQRALKTAYLRIDPAPILSHEQRATLQWCARYYQAPIGEVVLSALPSVLREGGVVPIVTAMGWEITAAGRQALLSMRASQAKTLLQWLAHDGPLTQTQINARFSRGSALCKRLHALGNVLAQPLSAPSSPWSIAQTLAPDFSANAQQQTAIDAICTCLTALSSTSSAPLQHAQASSEANQPQFRTFFLDGVTGSGKTEVYLQAIIACLSIGRQALVLVPEIGLTPQMLERFAQRLGIEIHAYHSGCSDGQRARVWAAMASGEGKVVIGTRSAVFMPMPKPGLIIVDEEHDGSYKQLEGMRYHARDVAIVRAQALSIPIVLGSATPSLESLQNIAQGRYTALRLTQRAGKARTPEVQMVDIRKRSLIDGLSEPAFAAIADCLARDEQALVFRNRRGYAPVLLCHDCGWSAQCSHCDAPLTVHLGAQRLQCHHCGAKALRPLACPACGSLGLQPQGAGTQRLEQALAARFSDVPLVRIDRDNTRRKSALEHQLKRLGQRSGILIGTQMLAKGHDLPNLTLVVVVGVDEGLYSADFRASERLGQLLIQVAGRAGRADKPGYVLLQTHHPEHRVLTELLSGGYRQLSATLLTERRAAQLPPYRHLALLRAQAKQLSCLEQFLHDANRAFAAALADMPKDSIELSGILTAPMPRRADQQRLQMLVQSSHRPWLQAVLSLVVPQLYAMPSARRVQWSIDVDPVDLY